MTFKIIFEKVLRNYYTCNCVRLKNFSNFVFLIGLIVLVVISRKCRFASTYFKSPCIIQSSEKTNNKWKLVYDIINYGVKSENLGCSLAIVYDIIAPSVLSLQSLPITHQPSVQAGVALDQPWAKCGLFAAAALRPIFCGLIADFCLKIFISYGQQYLSHLLKRPSCRHVKFCEISWKQRQIFSWQIPCQLTIKSPI